jgi:hypothetical protein
MKNKTALYNIYNIFNIIIFKNIKNIIIFNILILLYISFYIYNNSITQENKLSIPLDKKVIKEIQEDFKAQARLDYAAARSDFRSAKTLTDAQLISVLKSAGFKGQQLKEAWAIAKRESGGRPGAFNGNASTGDKSYGLFQINMIGNLGPTRMAKFELSAYEDLFDPYRNAEIAYYMSQGGKNWSAWYGLTPKAREFLLQYPND